MHRISSQSKDGKATHLLPPTEILCPSLSNPPNGMVDVEGTTIDSQAFYFCSSGYELQGSEIRVCTELEDGTADWSEEEPVCESELRWREGGRVGQDKFRKKGERKGSSDAWYGRRREGNSEGLTVSYNYSL